MRRRILLAALALLGPAPLAAQATAAAPRDPYALDAPLPVDPAVRIGTLPNGLRWYVRRNAKPENRAELRLVVNAGSILEDDDQRGLAHFLEHMAFNGTRTFAKNDIVKYLESIGVRFGADLNAYTSFDETVYILPVPTDSAGVLERAFEFLRDVAGAITFDSLEVVAERGVVLSEWRTGLGAGARLRDQQFPVYFNGSRYAQRLPIGDTAVLAGANPSTIRRFWTDWYRPDLMAVVAVGDVEPERLERLIAQHFGTLPAAPAGARARVTAAVPPHDGTLVTIATDRELTTTNVGVLWKVPPRSEQTVGDLRAALVERLYRGMLNQRFAELALRPDAPFLGAGAGGGRLVRATDYHSLDATAKEGQALEALAALLTEAERVARHGFLPSELDRARTNVLRGYERAYEERDKSFSSAFVGAYVDHFLTGGAIPGIAFEYEAAKRLLPGITLAEVNALARDRAGEANRVVSVAMPEKDGLRVPTEAEVRAVFARVATADVAAWTESVAEGALVRAAPAKGRVVSERTNATYGLVEWTLSNGVRVVVKPTDFNADQVLMTAFSPGGVSQVGDADALRASLAATVLDRGGVGDFSVIELQKKLTGKVASATAFIGDGSEGVSGRASPKDLETLLQLAWLRLTAPRADTAAHKALLAQLEAVLKNKDANPQLVFQDTIQRALAGDHPRARSLSVDVLPELQLDTLLALYRQRFADLGDMAVVFVGNVDTAALRPLAEQWLASLPAGSRREAHRDVGPPQFRGVLDKVVRKGIAPQSTSLILLAGDARWSPEEAHALEALADLLETRLLDRLREQLGGTYSVSVAGQMSRRPREEWQVTVSFGSAPEQADAMFAAVRAELDSLRRVPPSAEEVERVREKQRRELEVAKRQNAWWLSALQSRLEYGEPWSTLDRRDALIAGLSVERLAAAARRYLDETNRARFVLVPEK
jgi:zinc protease